MELTKKNLKTGRYYKVVHKRKGPFTAKLLDVVTTPPRDRQDRMFLTMEIDTSDGSGCERIRRVKGAQKTVTNIRPSLVKHIAPTSAPEGTKRSEPPPEPPNESVGGKLKKLLKFS